MLRSYTQALPQDSSNRSVGNPDYRHAINIGSVGKPKDNNPKGCYVLLTIYDKSSITDKETVQGELIRVEYDVEKAAKAAKAVE